MKMEEMLHSVVKQIDEYLELTPDTHLYNFWWQTETKRVLENVVKVLEQTPLKQPRLADLYNDLAGIEKWDKIEDEPQDSEYGTLMNKIQEDLRQAKKMILQRSGSSSQ